MIDTDQGYEYFVAYHDEHDRQPTIQQIADHFGITYQAGVRLRSLLEALPGGVPGKPIPVTVTERRAARDTDAMDFIRSYVVEHGWSPTVREVQDALGTRSVQGAHLTIERLVAAGLITKGPGPRQIRIVGSVMVLPEETA